MFLFLIIGLIGFFVYRDYALDREEKNPSWICKECGYAGPMETVTKGNFAIEVLLWICFFMPGLIYSIWRLTTRGRGCPECESRSIVPTDSPIGKKLFDAEYPKQSESGSEMKTDDSDTPRIVYPKKDA